MRCILSFSVLSNKYVINLNGLKSLIKEPACFNNLNKPSCIDLILSNNLNFFKYSTIFETNLSDFHLLTLTESKTGFQKQKQNKNNYLP